MSECPGGVVFPGLKTYCLEDPAHGVTRLLHCKYDVGGMPVLLIHGASAWHATFRIPGPDARGRPRSLMDWLALQGFQPWLLDWRGSGLVVGCMNHTELEAAQGWLDFDQAAARDVPDALRFIRMQTGSERVGAVGHCMGGGILAQAIASDSVSWEKHRLTHVVLLTLGLFYEAPLDSKLKVQDHVLERVLGTPGEPRAVDPRGARSWPQDLKALYDRWPRALRPHPPDDATPEGEMCARLAFMFGTPYLERRLVPEIHAGNGDERGELLRQFGPIPLRMYVHGARNSRGGWAAPYMRDKPFAVFEDGDATARERFRRLERVTLLTGDRNSLWHRDSIDRMYEWLRGRTPPTPGSIRKVIVRGFGHQDLLWSGEARERVFPDILRGLDPARPRTAETHTPPSGPSPTPDAHPDASRDTRT